MNYKIENSHLQVAINPVGAEICSIISKGSQQEYMWNGDQAIWGSTAPVLFPIIGALKDGSCQYKGTNYSIPKHGFIRNNKELVVKEQADDSITLSYKYSETTLKIYPFMFEFDITFTLKDNTLAIHHKVINHGEDTMLFSVGGHPAFKCPLIEGERYEDYYIEFNETETDERHLLSENGLTNGKTRPVLNSTNILNLTDTLFEEDALIFKNLKSRQASLKNKVNQHELCVTYPDFDYLGIWAKPKANFVCIEPWLGITDAEDTSGDLSEKEGMLSLEAKKEFEASYTFEIKE